ncbi:unnamed protein product, partial [Brassica oleracea]
SFCSCSASVHNLAEGHGKTVFTATTTMVSQIIQRFGFEVVNKRYMTRF